MFKDSKCNSLLEYDKNDETWFTSTLFTKHQFYRGWGKYDAGYYASEEEDPKLTPEWNRFYRLLHSQEFVDNIKKFSEVPVDKMKTFSYIVYEKGGLVGSKDPARIGVDFRSHERRDARSLGIEREG